jgi:peroxiredoxin
MGRIEIGDTLPNFPFEDIDGKVRLLSEVVTDKTLITYIKPDCDACLVELERLKQAANGQEDYEHILLITSANPVHMQKLRAEYGLGCVILYDEERRFGAMLKISSFPFNLVVNRQRVIEAIHTNTLLPDDYERFFDETRSLSVETAGVSTYAAEHGRIETPVDLSSRVTTAFRGRDVAISNPWAADLPVCPLLGHTGTCAAHDISHPEPVEG